MTDAPRAVDVLVIGGGQAGLAAGYYLRRAKADFVILDAQGEPGGAWRYAWPSLRLFSPAQYSSLPGRMMPSPPGGGYPSAEDTVSYLTDYEQRYQLPIIRPTTAHAVRRGDGHLVVETDRDVWQAKVVISATGIWWRPYIPYYPGIGDFRGRQFHTAGYRGPETFRGQRVVVVGGGNSAAQILADLSTVAHTTWTTRRPPRLLPDEVDGRALFDLATRRHRATKTGEAEPGIGDRGDIVAVPPVREARDRGALKAEPMFARLTPTGVAWSDGTTLDADAIIWCTGFRPGLGHLAPLRLRGHDGLIATEGTRAVGEPRLHLLGYGDWTGPASATLIGASRTAREAIVTIIEQLRTTRERLSVLLDII